MTGMPADLPTNIIALVAFLSVLAYMGWSSHKAKGVSAVVDEVREQVSNSHSTNLREEMDERHIELLEAVGDLRIDSVRELSRIRHTLTDVDERTARIGTEVVADRKVMYAAIARADRSIAKHHPEED